MNPSTARTVPSDASRTPSRTSPESGSTSASSIQSAMAAANDTCPSRASRIAAGPLAGAFLKSSWRRHQIPPPPCSVQPSCSCSVIAHSAEGPDRPGERAGALHREAEPGDVVVVAVGPRAGVAPPHAAAQRPDRARPLRSRGPELRIHQAVEQVGLPPVVPRERAAGARRGQRTRPMRVAGDHPGDAPQVPAHDRPFGDARPFRPVDLCGSHRVSLPDGRIRGIPVIDAIAAARATVDACPHTGARPALSTASSRSTSSARTRCSPGATAALAIAGGGPGYAVSLVAAEPGPVRGGQRAAGWSPTDRCPSPARSARCWSRAGSASRRAAAAAHAVRRVAAPGRGPGRRGSCRCAPARSRSPRPGCSTGCPPTTHWRYAPGARRPTTRPSTSSADPIYLRQGRIWTSGGVTAGIDLALALVEADHGVDLAQRIARELVVFLRRPGGQSQFAGAGLGAPGPAARRSRAAQDLIHADPAADLRVPGAGAPGAG